jgi:predicted MFS family arabinose efflux permease
MSFLLRSPSRRKGPDASPGASSYSHFVISWPVIRGERRDLGILIAARVLMSASRALAGIIAPIYLTLIGFSALGLGALALVVGVTAAVMSTAIGLASDRMGRRPFLVTVPLLAALAAIAFTLTRSPLVLFIAAGAGSFGRGMGAGGGMVGPYQPAEQAFATEITPARERNSVFGKLAAASSLGALIGAPLAALAGPGSPVGAAATEAFRGPFIACAVLSGAAGLLALALHEPRHPAPIERTGRLPHWPRRSLPLLMRLWVTNSLNGLAVGMFGPFITYWFFVRFGVSAGQIGLLYAVVNALSVVATLSAARLAARWGLVRTVSLVRIAQALLLVPLVLAPTFVMAGAIYLARMIVARIGMPLRQSYVLAMADPEERASVGALSSVPSQAAMSVAPLAAGYLFDEVSLSLPFLLGGMLQLAAAVLYWGLFHLLSPEEERPAAPTAPGPAPADLTDP